MFEGFRNSAGDDWDSNLKSVSTSQGEFAQAGADPVVADLNAMSFSECPSSPMACADEGMAS